MNLFPNATSKLERELERQIIRSMNALLWNWGRWRWQEDQAEIERMTGVRRCSTLATVMQYAPYPTKSGYGYEYREQPDADLAQQVDRAVRELPEGQGKELERYYIHNGGNGSPACQSRRRRAILSLANAVFRR